MEWTVSFIVIFGIAILVPAVWSVIGRITGNTKLWPAGVGMGWALVLMLMTWIGTCNKWGECSSTRPSSEEAVRCAGSGASEVCHPDVWAPECRERVTGCGVVPLGSFCPSGQSPVFAYCERMQTGGVKQPWSSWSTLAFIASGLWLLWFLQYTVRPGRRTSGSTTVTTVAKDGAPNPMLEIGWLSVPYGMIVVFMGPASMWYHASMKGWAGLFDSTSVVMWLSFNAAYVWYALLGAMWGHGRGIERRFIVLGIWAVLVIGYVIIAASGVPDAALIGFLVSGGLWGVSEVIYVFVAAFARGVAFRRTWWLFLINFILLGGTMVTWLLFNAGVMSASWCQSVEWFPGHALFHIGAAISTVVTFISFASEERVSTATK